MEQTPARALPDEIRHGIGLPLLRIPDGAEQKEREGGGKEEDPESERVPDLGKKAALRASIEAAP
jgi:hypothetical protein